MTLLYGLFLMRLKQDTYVSVCMSRIDWTSCFSIIPPIFWQKRSADMNFSFTFSVCCLEHLGDSVFLRADRATVLSSETLACNFPVGLEELMLSGSEPDAIANKRFSELIIKRKRYHRLARTWSRPFCFSRRTGNDIQYISFRIYNVPYN